MNLFTRTLMASAAAATLALAACGESANDGGANSEESSMTAAAEDNGASPAADGSVRPADATRAQTAAGDVDSLPEGDQCGASKVAAFVSQNATPKVRAQVVAEVGHDRIRWIGPDTVVTMDYRPDRLNVMLDENGVITGARCS